MSAVELSNAFTSDCVQVVAESADGKDSYANADRRRKHSGRIGRPVSHAPARSVCLAEALFWSAFKIARSTFAGLVFRRAVRTSTVSQSMASQSFSPSEPRAAGSLPIGVCTRRIRTVSGDNDNEITTIRKRSGRSTSKHDGSRGYIGLRYERFAEERIGLHGILGTTDGRRARRGRIVR